MVEEPDKFTFHYRSISPGSCVIIAQRGIDDISNRTAVAGHAILNNKYESVDGQVIGDMKISSSDSCAFRHRVQSLLVSTLVY